ncbi:MAG: hypothetical protein IJT05_05130 [Lachnospiraceae bacterium]|nr:hypothetical protein [Lachnospiraceae bacterium]
MGKRSARENKNIYQLSREEAGLTREKAASALEFISADRIENHAFNAYAIPAAPASALP